MLPHNNLNENYKFNSITTADRSDGDDEKQKKNHFQIKKKKNKK